MTCPKCSTELAAEAKFCPNCGTPAPRPKVTKPTNQDPSAPQEPSAPIDPSVPQGSPESQEQSAASAEVVVPGKTNNKLKMIIAAALLVVVLIGSVVTYSMFFMNNPKNIYLLAEYKAVESVKEEFNSKFAEEIEFNSKLSETPSTNTTKISGNFDIKNDFGEFDMIQEILDQAVITINTKSDPKKEANSAGLALKLDGETAFDLDLYQSSKQVALKLPFLSDDYFYLNLKQYGEFMRMLDPSYEGPEEVQVGGKDLYDLALTEKEIEQLEERYKGYLDEALKEEYFTLKKNVEYKHDGEKLKLRQITLKMSEKQTEAFINGFIDKLIADKKLHSILAKRVVEVNEVSAFQENSKLTDKAYVEKEIKATLKDIKAELKDASYPAGFKSTLLIDRDERIIDRQIKFAVNAGNEDLNFNIATKNVPLDKENSYRELKAEVTPEDEEEGKLALTLSNELTQEKTKQTDNFKANILFEEYETVVADYDFTMKTVTKGEKPGKQDIVYDFKLKLDGDSFYGSTPILSGKIKQENDISVKDKKWNQKYDVDVNFKDEQFGAKVSLMLDSKTKLVDKVSLPKLSKSNSENILDLTEEDMMEIMMELQNSIFSLYGDMGMGYY